MGLATGLRLLAQGYSVVIVSSNEEKLGAAQRELGGAVEAVRVDLSDRDAVESLARKIREGDPIHALVNSAGVFAPKAFLEHGGDDYDRYHELNRGTFFLTQAVAANMIRHQVAGAIVNVGSMWAHQAVKATPSSAYSMAKAGLHSLTQHLAMELSEHRIRVNAVAPAVVVTPIYGAFIKPEEIEETLKSGFGDFHPLGRVGEPDDIASAIEFLISERSGWTTGAVWNIDGGVMAGRN